MKAESCLASMTATPHRCPPLIGRCQIGLASMDMGYDDGVARERGCEWIRKDDGSDRLDTKSTLTEICHLSSDRCFTWNRCNQPQSQPMRLKRPQIHPRPSPPFWPVPNRDAHRWRSSPFLKADPSAIYSSTSLASSFLRGPKTVHQVFEVAQVWWVADVVVCHELQGSFSNVVVIGCAEHDNPRKRLKLFDRAACGGLCPSGSISPVSFDGEVGWRTRIRTYTSRSRICCATITPSATEQSVVHRP